MLISPAYAQAVGGGGFDIQALIPLVLIFVVFYFLLIRPQQKKAKQHRELIQNLRRGDRVVTAGGVIGTIARLVDENEVLVDIAEGTRVRILKATISNVLAKPDPAAANEGEEPKPKKGRTKDKPADSDADSVDADSADGD